MNHANKKVGAFAAAGLSLLSACATQPELNSDAIRHSVASFSPRDQRDPRFASAADDCARSAMVLGERPASEDRNMAVGGALSVGGAAAGGAILGAVTRSPGAGAIGAGLGLLAAGASLVAANEERKAARAREVGEYVSECIAQALAGPNGRERLSVTDSRAQRRATIRIEQNNTGEVVQRHTGAVRVINTGAVRQPYTPRVVNP